MRRLNPYHALSSASAEIERALDACREIEFDRRELDTDDRSVIQAKIDTARHYLETAEQIVRVDPAVANGQGDLLEARP